MYWLVLTYFLYSGSHAIYSQPFLSREVLQRRWSTTSGRTEYHRGNSRTLSWWGMGQCMWSLLGTKGCTGGVQTAGTSIWWYRDALFVLMLWIWMLVFSWLGALAFNGGYFGQSSGPRQIDNVRCAGNEVNVLNCSHSTQPNCGTNSDAGVRCFCKLITVVLL